MAEMYRLIFAAEVAPDQHAAVVKRRLQKALKLNDEQLAQMFAGTPLVVKKTPDRAVAAKWQAVFKSAGARLRVKVEQAAEPDPKRVTLKERVAAHQKAAVKTRKDALPDIVAGAAAKLWRLFPVGSFLLQPTERRVEEATEITPAEFELADAGATLGEARAPEPAPKVDIAGWTLAEVGERLGVSEQALEELSLDIEFDLADAGAQLVEPAAPPVAVVDIDAVSFDVADVGATMDQAPETVAPPPPDTSRLSVVSD